MTKKESLKQKLRGFEWTRKRRINISITVIFIGFILFIICAPLSWFLWGATIREYTTTGYVGFDAVSVNGERYPSISYRFIATFSAVGSFSVDNPVTATMTITNVTANPPVANLLDYYSVVCLENAKQCPIAHYEDGSDMPALIHLSYAGIDKFTGTKAYRGTAVIEWTQEGVSYGPVVLPEGAVFISTAKLEKDFLPIITISGISDTLTQGYTESTNKLTLAIGSFSIILLIPILEAIFEREEKTVKETPPPSQRGLTPSKPLQEQSQGSTQKRHNKRN
jgi:hypothetical protein